MREFDVKWKIIDTARHWTRTQWLLAGACAALVIGAITPWYTLPAETLAAFGSSLWLPTIMRAIPAVAAIVVARMLFSADRNGRLEHSRKFLWACLFVILLFPCLVATFSPAVAYVASAFDQQRESVAYHIETHYPESQSQWKQSISIDPFEEVRPYTPDGLTIGYIDTLLALPNGRPFGIDNTGFFQIASWDRMLMEGLNYLPGFLASAGWGWPVAIAALVTALAAVYIARPAAFFWDLSKIWPWCLGGIAAVVLLILGPCFVTRQISIWQARGEHDRAATAAHLLYACYPPMQGDTSFMIQMAESDAVTNQSTPGVLQFARGVECWRADRLDMARNYFEQALAISEDNYLIRSYLSATLLRMGAQLFEQGQPLAAASMFDEARRVFPNHLQATYCSMIAQAAHGNFPRSMQTASELRNLQKNFRQPSIAAMGQAFLHEAWADYRAGRLPEAWHAYRESVDPGIWE
jgi:tetratricopeptide (TPR) repeat protein